jgi:O-antigen biosynthesis protein
MSVEIVNSGMDTAIDAAALARTQAPPTVGLVSVLVACCGQQDLTRLCVASLLRHCRPPYELHFLDSGSLDGTGDFLAGVAMAAPVKVTVSRVAPVSLQSGQRKEESVQVRGDFVVMLNNDTIVTDGWLNSMITGLNRDPQIGISAPMSNYAPPPQLIERVPYGMGPGIAGAESRGHNHNSERANEPSMPIAALERFAAQWREHNAGKFLEPERLGGGCVMFKRKALQSLGAFPTRNVLGAFDTTGLSERVRQAGFRLVVCAEAFIHNFGSRSAARAV